MSDTRAPRLPWSFAPTPLGQAVVLAALLGVGVACWFVQSGGVPVWPVVGGERWRAAALVLLLYGLFCGALWTASRRRRQVAVGDAPQRVLHASQTGFAEDLAGHAAAALAGGGWQLGALADLDPAAWAGLRRALFVVSTTGEGDAPDGAARFSDRLMRQRLDLSGLEYGLLALGDRRYAAFCAFGRALDAWLRHCGARPLFEAIEVDNGDAAALARWQARLETLGGQVGAGMPGTAEFGEWRLLSRQLMNPGSEGGEVHHLRLQPAAASCGTPGFDWRAGDIAEVRIEADDGTAVLREYSIASVPADGTLDLVVRQSFTADGRLGIGSGWLTRQRSVGDTLLLRLRPNRGFRVEDNEAPLLLIGNGTGIAGLRAHLRARLAGPRRRHWLLFGERHAAHDALFDAELRQWRADGHLERLDRVYSRDQADRRYVQHRLQEVGGAVREWVDAGAIILVCGSLQGMAGAVDDALRAILGEAGFDVLRASGRYRRDVY